MDVQELELPGVKLVTPRRFSDQRGFFMEIWSDRLFREKVCDVPFVQDNHSYTLHPGTIRGLHFQREPFAQGKFVRVVQGAVFDVVVDIRPGSATYGQHLTMRLDAEDGTQLWVPPGFLHGFCTLEPQTAVCYKVTNYYSQKHDAGVLWNDPDLGIAWPATAGDAVLSEKDRVLPLFRELALD
jgi:dTDP-4-dehydrorhamnose 3,5-epimerase